MNRASSERLTEIRARRERLIAQCAREREEVAALASELARPVAIAGVVLALAAYVRANPSVLAFAAIALLFISPQRTLRWARRGWVLWRGYRWIRMFIGAGARS